MPLNSRYFNAFCAFGTTILIFGILLLAFWIRIQGVDNIPTGQFTETDAYLYCWQAQLISKHERLPERDMHRWLPYGRDLNQTLNLYSYVLAYVHKALVLGWPNLFLYYVTLYAPTVCFVLGLGTLCFFLSRTFGVLFSCAVGVLLATLPGPIERSTAGFSDRDSWCLMLGILAVTTYLRSLQTQSPKMQLMWILVSGFSIFLGGLSWEGFGMFLGIILCVELWKFLTSKTEEGLGYYFIWMLTFVPTLYLAAPAYRSGEGFAKHISILMLISPLGLFFIRLLRQLLLTKTSIAKKYCSSAQILVLSLTLASLALASGYIINQFSTFAETTVPFSQNKLMQSVSELHAPNFKYWIFRYSNVFLFGILGLMFCWKKLGLFFFFRLFYSH